MAGGTFGWQIKARLFECEVSRFVLFSYRGSHEVRSTFDFSLSLEPVLKLLAREAATLQINFVSATPNLVVIWCAAFRNTVRMRRDGVCVKLQRVSCLVF